MTKKKKIIIAVAIVLIILIAYFTFFHKGKGLLGGKSSVDPRPCSADENYNRDWLVTGLPSEDDIHAPGETTECQRKYMTSICGTESWKCRKMIKAGAYIPTDYVYNQSGWNNCKVSDERILSWVYEIYYLTGKDWAEKEPYALLKQAEYQACAETGVVSF